MPQTFTLLQGDALTRTAGLAPETFQCVVTSPPYWGLRDYGEGQEVEWPEVRFGLMPGLGEVTVPAMRCALGLEADPVTFVGHLVLVFREVRRVLREDGVVWVNLGDSYAGSGRGGYSGVATGLEGSVDGQDLSRAARELQRNPSSFRRDRADAGGFRHKAAPEVKNKDLVGIPWMVAFALRADGWYLRSEVIWSKPNPMPESTRDRPTKAHEQVFLLSKSPRYFYDAEAIAEPVAASSIARLSQDIDAQQGSNRAHAGGKTNGAMKAVGGPRKKFPAGWDAEDRAHTGKQGRYPGPIRPKGNAKTFRGGGAYTGSRSFDNDAEVDRESHGNAPNDKGTRNKRSVWTIATQPFPEAHFATFPEALVEPCVLAGSRPGDLVLDPFSGAGTTGVVALELGRSYVGIELNPEYLEMSRRRLSAVAPLLVAELAG